MRHFPHYKSPKKCDFHCSHAQVKVQEEMQQLRLFISWGSGTIIHILLRCSLYFKFWGTLSVRNVKEPSMNSMLERTFCQLYYTPLKHFFFFWDSSFYSGKESGFASKEPGHSTHLSEEVTTVPLHRLVSAKMLKNRQDLVHQNNLPAEPFLSSLCSALLFPSLRCKTLI